MAELTITLEDGTTLTDSTDLGLARQWAERTYDPAEWEGFTFRQRSMKVAEALSALRAAMDEG